MSLGTFFVRAVLIASAAAYLVLLAGLLVTICYEQAHLLDFLGGIPCR